MEKFIDKIKKYMQTMDNKKLMNNLIIILIIGIILLIIANIFIEERKTDNTNLESTDIV